VGLCSPAWFLALVGRTTIWAQRRYGRTVLSPRLVLAGLLLMLRVFAVNSFASRTIQVLAGQKVISSGPYRLVRHPMYLGSVMMWLATPLALGSYFCLPLPCSCPFLRVAPAQRGKRSS